MSRKIIWVEIIWAEIVWVEIIWNVTEPKKASDKKSMEHSKIGKKPHPTKKK